MFLRRIRPARRTAVVMLAVAGAGLAAAPAQAHPSDETIQQVYLTPTRTRLDIELDVTPGVLVAPSFARTTDPAAVPKLLTDKGPEVGAGRSADAPMS
ncbi:hypothetical protein ACF081_18045 [Streptomyces longwoodensis]|uniref:hypothetical protein n=1 Tax=Streptomyces longwoodensis TaxID=68231 RepID=UPI0036F51B6E